MSLPLSLPVWLPRSLSLLLPLSLVLLLVAMGCSSESGGYAGPVFTNVTQAAGLAVAQRSSEFPGEEAPYFSGGAAAADFDNDGWVDLFVSRIDAPDSLYRNLGDGTFADVTQDVGLGGERPSNGAAWADVDNDGDADLIVTTLDIRCYLYINDGAGQFSEEAEARRADAATGLFAVFMSVTPGDINNDGWVDLHTNEWQGGWSRDGIPSHSRLLHNRGAGEPGFFDDLTTVAGVEFVGDEEPDRLGASEVFAFTSRMTDFDNDGWADLAVIGDFETSRLFWNNTDGTFTDGTVAAGVGTDENGMGTAVGDYDNDGDLDWFVTSIFDARATCAPPNRCDWGITGNRLFRNDGGRVFTDVTDDAGVRDGGWGWGAVFFDYDNDGDLDLAMANGQVFPGEASGFDDDPLRLWQNDGAGGFTEVAAPAGFADARSAKGIVTFDYDRDGDVDVFVTNNGSTPVLYRNDANGAQSWLRVELDGVTSSRDAFGARVVVRVNADGAEQMREVSGGSHYLSQSESTVHFGLGTLAAGQRIAEVRVFWPVTGETQVLRDVEPNQVLRVTEE